MKFAGLIFDFDGVLIESEYEGNRHLAALLTQFGHPTTPDEAITHFMGLSGPDFIAAIETRIGQALPAAFHTLRRAEDERVMREGVDAVAGAIAFIRSLPPDLPKAVASSSSMRWIERHLDHVGLREAFGDKVFSGKEHVARGKPAPDLYLHAAAQIDVPIERCAIIEDSPVGVTGAVASGAHVIGLAAGAHCRPGHAETLRRLGAHDVAASFEEVTQLVGL